MIIQNATGGRMDVGSGIASNVNANLLRSNNGALGQWQDDTNSMATLPRSSGLVVNRTAMAYIGQFIKLPDRMLHIREGGIIEEGELRWRLPYDRATGESFIVVPKQDAKYDLPAWDNPFSNILYPNNVSVRVTAATKQAFIAWGLLSPEQTEERIITDVENGTLNPDGTSLKTKDFVDDFVTKYTDTANNAVSGVKFGASAVIVVALVAAAIWFLPRTGG